MLACPRCGEANPERARFCLNCGTPLGERAPAVREVRKIVTVVFCDLTGSTALGERLEPESLRRVISLYFDRMRQAIGRHGGTVEKFIGDAVMAVFGVPEAHEDDALRAVATAAEMQVELARLNDELGARWGVHLQVRIGVNTGEVLAGDAGLGQLITGDAVNVAARLEQAAEPGQILIGRTTYQLTRDAVRVEPVPPLRLKGKEAAVPAYRLLEVFAHVPGRARRADVSLVGRHKELRALASAYRRAVEQRRCQLMTVVGAAGVGKSRLVVEAMALLYDEATVIAGTCPEYGEGMTFWPAAEAVREAAGLTIADSRDQALSQLRSVLRDDAQEDAVAANLVQLLGLGGEQASVDELAWAVRKLFESVAAERPLVVVLEDMHWAEPSFLDLIDHVVAWAREAPIVVICVGRPELLDQRPSWAGERDNSTAIRLEPLTDAETAVLLHRLLQGERLAEPARAWVTEAAEGNPLFVEETLAMLLDDGVLRQEDGSWVATTDLDRVAIPPTIESLLVARIDQLGPRDGVMLQRSSVIGKVFGTSALASLCPPQERPEVPQSLLRLTRRDVIAPEPAGFLGGEAFAIRHALLRDAAYGMLTKGDRAELHERFAEWLERAAGEWAVEYEELLAYHLEAAYRFRRDVGMVDDHGQRLAGRAAEMFASAGRRAMAREDVPAAAGFLRRSADLLDPADPTRAAVLHDLGRALIPAGRLGEAATALEDAMAAAVAAGDRRRQVDVGVTRLRLKLQTDPATTIELASVEAQRAIAEFEQLGDRSGLARTWHLVAAIEWNRSCVGAAEQALERAVAEARAAGDVEEEAANLANLTGVALFGSMPVDAGVRRCEAALALAGPRRMLEGRALRSLAGMRAMQGSMESARELVARSIAIYEDLGQPQWTAGALQVLGIVEGLAGEPAAAERALRQSYELFEAEGDTGHVAFAAALLSRALYDLGRDEEAERLTRVSEQAAAPDDAGTQMQWRSVRAKVLARRGELQPAEALARDAARIGRSTELHMLADVVMDLGEVLAAAGRPEEAVSHVEEAIERYERKGNVVAAERARRVLSRLQEVRTSS